MALSFLLHLFARRSDGGLFGWLKSRDDNRALIALERERRQTTLEVIRQLEHGDEYREGTTVGWREIRKAQIPSSTFVVVSEAGSDQDQATKHKTELPGQQALPIDPPAAPPQLPCRPWPAAGSVGSAEKLDLPQETRTIPLGGGGPTCLLIPAIPMTGYRVIAREGGSHASAALPADR